MRSRVVRHFCVASLYLLMHLGGGGCSSSEEGEEDVEAMEEGEEGEEAANEEGSEEGGEEVANEEAPAEQGEGEAVVQEEGGEQSEEAPAEEGTTEEVAEQPAETENELKEIVSEMNAQEAPPADAGQSLPPTDAVAEVAPPAAPAETAAPADAAPAAPAAAPAAMAGGVLPEMGSKMPYVVRPGDTLGKIAQRVYGDQSKWRSLQQLSSLTNPSRIYPGDVVYYQLTPESQTFARAYETLPRQEVVANAGDTLASIAQRVLGSSRHWKEVWRQNDKIDNPDVINPGQTIFYINPQSMASLMGNGSGDDFTKASIENQSINSFAKVLNSVEAVSTLKTVTVAKKLADKSFGCQRLMI